MMLEENGKSENGALEKEADIFSDEGYLKSGCWRISTSHCGSPSLCLFGFGPVVKNGFGVGYQIFGETISFVITSKISTQFNSSTIFAAQLAASLLHMNSIVLAHPDELRKPSRSLDFTHPTNSVFQRSSFASKNVA